MLQRWNKIRQYLSDDFLGGPKVVKLAWVINLQKGGTLLTFPAPTVNPYAAVPSLHFGWAMIIGGAMVATMRHPALRGLGLATEAVWSLPEGFREILRPHGGDLTLAPTRESGDWTEFVATIPLVPVVAPPAYVLTSSVSVPGPVN